MSRKKIFTLLVLALLCLTNIASANASGSTEPTILWDIIILLMLVAHIIVIIMIAYILFSWEE